MDDQNFINYQLYFSIFLSGIRVFLVIKIIDVVLNQAEQSRKSLKCLFDLSCKTDCLNCTEH